MNNNNNSQQMSKLLSETASYASWVYGDNSTGLKDFRNWLTKTNWTQEQLYNYVVQYYINIYSSHYADYIVGYILVLCSILGLFGAIAEYIVLRGPEYADKPSFIYHRAVNYIEFVDMWAMNVNGLSKLVPNAIQPVWFVFMTNNLGLASQAGLRSVVDYLTVFITIERAFALWLPFSFWRINKPSVAYASIAVSVFTGLCFTPSFVQWQVYVGSDGFVTTSRSPYYQWLLDHNYLSIRETIIVAKVPLSVILTTIVICGIVRFTQRRKNLIAPSLDPKIVPKPVEATQYSNTNTTSHHQNNSSTVAPTNAAQAKSTLNNKKVRQSNRETMNLTIICLVKTLPLALNSISYSILHVNLEPQKVTGAQAVVLPYESALPWVENLGLAYISFTFFGNFNYVFEHCFHFYMNYVFCTSFRISTNERLFKNIFKNIK